MTLTLPEKTMKTVPQALLETVGRGGDISIYGGRGSADELLTRAELVGRGCRAARYLRERGVEPGERVMTVLPNGKAFLTAVFGTWFAGGVIVPIAGPPPVAAGHEFYLKKAAQMIQTARPRVIVGTSQALALISSLTGLLDDVVLIAENELLLLPTGGEAEPLENLDPETIAHLQFTSGSTGFPKAAAIKHGQLTANVCGIGERSGTASDNKVISWTPVHHDMGLIGGILFPIQHGMEFLLIRTEDFIRDPSIWLRKISDFRATQCAAPPFAFSLLTERVPDNRLTGVDLSSWRFVGVGAEPIFPHVIKNFNRRFARYGLKENVLCTVYGLAEATLLATCTSAGQPLAVENINLDVLRRESFAAPAAPGNAQSAPVVGCGTPLVDTEVRIADETGAELADRQQGKILVRGVSVMEGYLGAAEQPFLDGWLDTGDLGFKIGDELFVTGRAKDLIIRGGTNIHPQEIEHAAETVPGVRMGRTAAFSVVRHEAGTEEIILAVETKITDETERARLIDEITRETIRQAGVRVDRVELVPSGFVEKTTSGKIQRSLCREKLIGSLNGTPV